MKHLICAIALFTCIATQATGQITYGLRITASPSVNPGTSTMIANRGTANESLVNFSNINYSEQFGLMGRYDMQRFWFMTELLYGQANTQMSMVGIPESLEGQAPTLYTEKNSYLEMPVTAGVRLGIVEIFSGFTAARDLSVRGETLEIDGYTKDVPTLRFGWHSGVGINLGHVLVDMRYQQQFRNYGQGRYLNGEELLMHNAPGRLVFSLGYRI